jgi:hypothetical protein
MNIILGYLLQKIISKRKEMKNAWEFVQAT